MFKIQVFSDILTKPDFVNNMNLVHLVFLENEKKSSISNQYKICLKPQQER
jgi:hypothetical protein